MTAVMTIDVGGGGFSVRVTSAVRASTINPPIAAENIAAAVIIASRMSSLPLAITAPTTEANSAITVIPTVSIQTVGNTAVAGSLGAGFFGADLLGVGLRLPRFFRF
jgi:hypothetical protein